MKAIRIGLEHYDMFQAMTPGKVKKIILGLMDFASGRCATGMNKETYPTFEKLREQLETNDEVGACGCRKEEDEGFEAVFNAYEKERMSCEEKVKALRKENDTVIRKENDACDEEYKALVEERKYLEGEYKSLMESLKSCERDERKRYRGKFEELEKRRGALRERRGALDERRKALMERSVNFLADSAINLQEECYALKEEVALLDEIRQAFKEANYGEYRRRMPEFTRERLEGVSFVNREAEIISVMNGTKMYDAVPFVHSYLGTAAPVVHAHLRTREEANSKGGEPNNREFTFTPEVWKVVDENWEQLKDAVYRMKVKKEELPDVDLPAEAWDVLDHHFDELVRLFHM